MSRPGNRTLASTVRGEHSRKEPFEQLFNSYLEQLHMCPWQLFIFSQFFPIAIFKALVTGALNLEKFLFRSSQLLGTMVSSTVR